MHTVNVLADSCEMLSGAVRERALGPCKMPLPALLECVGQLLSFLWAEVLCGNTEVG